jgi:hypothetical protein
MDAALPARAGIAQLRKRCAGIGLAAAVAAGIGAALDVERFLQSYLLAYLFWIAIPLGSLALFFLHRLTGGAWGFAIRRVLESAARTLPWMALFFVPIALGVGTIYPWADQQAVEVDPVLQHKQAWLNTPAFLARALGYFVLWFVLARAGLNLSSRLDRAGEPRTVRRLRALAGPAIGLYVISMTLAAVDWAMSLEPHWYSTLYGIYFVVGQGLATFAFAILLSTWLAPREAFARWLDPNHFHDLGKLLFAFVFLWAYLAYSQYLIIWSGNLAEETPWYLHRSSHGWQVLALTLIGSHFFLPFALLLSRKFKRAPRLLARVAALLLVARLLDLAWVIIPAFHPEGIALSWMDLVVPIALGGLWMWLFLGNLERQRLPSLQDEGFARKREDVGHAHA